MSEHVEWQELHELLKELAQKEYGDKYGEQIFWYFQDVIDDSCKLDVLEEENKRLKIIEEKYKDSQLYIHDFKEEIEKLNNIINELEKWLDEEYQYYDKYGSAPTGCAMGQINRTKDKLQELKGSDKE